MVHRRRYLPGGFMAHASGYVGEVSEQQIEVSNGRFRPGDFVGKSGLERQYNDLLQGTDGMRRVVVNSVGKEVDHLPTQEAILASRFSSPSITTCNRSRSNRWALAMARW